MAEALACGTPVVAGRRGSVTEAIINGVTGLVGETDDDLVALCQRIHAIDRAACRREATCRFSPSVMAAGYEAIYRTTIVSNQRRFTDGLTLSDGRLLDEVRGARTP
jgi:glycosyltransferase involved in cell wall biosynthesis